MNCINKKIGIWGLGISGTSLLNYFLTVHKESYHSITVLDSNPICTEKASFFAHHNITHIIDNPFNRENFLVYNDYIFASPGIDLTHYKIYSDKFIAELDFFQTLTNKPIIAITGTVGKTSITHLLNTLLNNAYIPTATGGNIGIGMFDLINRETDYILLETSSFQLEHTKTFKPDCAIWTNFYPNHLDRHKTLEQYHQAKQNIFLHQTHDQKTLLPLELEPTLRPIRKKLAHNKPYAFFSNQKPCYTNESIKNLNNNDLIYYLDDEGNIIKGTKKIVSSIIIPDISYPINWLIISATLDLLGYDPETILQQTKQCDIPNNRLEHVATINDTLYYNDSKSTIMQATLASVNALVKKYNPKPLILILGGTSKGVNRADYIKQLSSKTTHIICFGAEAKILKKTCDDCQISSESYTTLEEAVLATQKINSPACILFSPGGASFDLFKNYEERGECFKKIVATLQENNSLTAMRCKLYDNFSRDDSRDFFSK